MPLDTVAYRERQLRLTSHMAGGQEELPIHKLLRERLTESYGDNLSRMAEAVDATPTMVAKWTAFEERRRAIPSPNSCRKIARGLHLDPDDVLAAAGHRDQAGWLPEPSDPRLAAIFAAMERSWETMDDQLRDHVEHTAMALFHVPSVRRVTDQPNGFGRPKMDGVQQLAAPIAKRRYQSQSLHTQRLAWGWQPAAATATL